LNYNGTGERRKMRRVFSGLVVLILLISTLTLAVNIQPVRASGTIYINADGSISPWTAPISTVDNITYTFTGDINDSIVIERDNIVADGAGHTLQGTNASGSIGTYVAGRSNVTIKNTNIKNFYYGIEIGSSSSSTISGNNITNNAYGIQLLDSSLNSTISGNNITANDWEGIELDSSLNSTISGNNITNNGGSGIWLYSCSDDSISGNNIAKNGIGIYLDESLSNGIVGNSITNNSQGIVFEYSPNNTLRSNTMVNNSYNFHVDFPRMNDVDASNTVDGKPIYYWIDKQDMTVPLNAGYVALLNCTRIIVQNLTLTNNGHGVIVASVTNSIITKNNIAKNYYGIWLDYSSNNTVSGNNVINNYYGIYIYGSSDNTLSGNNITANIYDGIGLYGSSDNTVSGNSFFSNGLFVWVSYGNFVVDNLVSSKPLVYLEGVSDHVVDNAGQVILLNCNNILVESLNLSNATVGVEIYETTHAKIVNNNITANNEDGVFLYESSDSTISGNNITTNGCGIYLYGSSNTVSGNNITANNSYGIYLYGSSNTVDANNITNNNYDGIGLPGSSNTVSGNNITNNNYYGIELSGSSNTISGNTIRANNWDGIDLSGSSNTLSGNVIANNWEGISIGYSSYNIITGNNITANNEYGILLYECSNNTIFGNNITANNEYGIFLWWPSNNTIYHNNFMNNMGQVYSTGSVNVWDDGYPSGGNYWSDYGGVDVKKGVGQDLPGWDGIGDTPYTIDIDNLDHYPLMNPWGSPPPPPPIIAVYYSVEPVASAPLTDVNASINGLETPPAPSSVGRNFTVEIHVRNATTTNVPAGVAGVEVHFDFSNILNYCTPVGFSNMIGQAGGALAGPSILYGINPGFYEDHLGSHPVNGPPYTNATFFNVAAASGSGPWNSVDGLVASITFQITSQPPEGQPDFSASLQIAGSDIVDMEGAEVPLSVALGTLQIDAVGPLSAVTAEVRVAPLNLNSHGKWTAGYIELPEGFNVSDIDTSSLLLNGTVMVDPSAKVMTGDFDNDSALELWAEFNRTQLVNLIASEGIASDNVTLLLTGQLLNGTQLEGTCQTTVSSLMGDVNCDGKVGLQDLQQVANAYGSHPRDPNWNSNADFAAPWQVISLTDLVTLAVYYGQHNP
jgi:parallel beta-helix repeat protein